MKQLVHSCCVLSKKKLLYLLVLAFLSLTQKAISAPVGENTAKKAATHFAMSMSALRSNAELKLVYTGGIESEGLRAEQAPLLYVYNIGNNAGFVIVSGDDNAYPILGYGDKGGFEVTHMPENIAHWLDFYQKEISYIKDNGEGICQNTKQEWDALLSESKVNTISGYVLSTAKWNQDDPYNSLCPKDSLNKTSVTGCVATAMAIAMKYHKWPEKGIGSNSYKFENDSKEISQSFEVAYDWDNMLDTYAVKDNIPLWNALQAEAVATLIYHCGVAVNMKYSSVSSGAYTFDTTKALINHFGYDNGMYVAYRTLYSTSIWNNMIRKELDENRPVIYTGVKTDNSAHMFIIDGYSYSDNYFHVNWGWNGVADGYYLLSSLEPTWTGIGGGKEGEGFAYDQEAIIGMKKAEKGSEANYEFYFPQPEKRAPWGLYSDKERIVQNELFHLCFTYIYERGHRDFDGAFAIFLLDKEGEIKDVVDAFAYELPGGYVLYESEGAPYTITEDIEDGDILKMYYSTDFKYWSPIKGEKGAATELSVYAESLVNNQSLQIKEKIVISPTRVISDITVHSTDGVPILEISAYEMSGRLITKENIYGGASQYTISLSGQSPGIYILSVKTSTGETRHKIIKE